jgi:NACHT domain
MLSAPDPHLNHSKALEGRLAGSGTWLVNSKQYADWKTNPGSFLWLHGIPGCGKTILSSTIIDDILCYCRNNPTAAVAYFYFDFKDNEKQQHQKMIRSLSKQLSLQSAMMPPVLITLFSSCEDGEQQPTASKLLPVLQRMIQEPSEFFIILDALDDCLERQELLADIDKIAGWGIEKLHIISTSRKEKDIEKTLGPLVGDRGKIWVQSALVNDDISAYIQERLQTDRSLRRWQKRPETLQEIKARLIGKADGM